MEERVEIHVQVRPGRHRRPGLLRRLWRRILNTRTADAVLISTTHVVLLGGLAVLTLG